MVDSEQLDEIRKPDSYSYRPIHEIHQGDYIHWWGHDVEVIDVIIKEDANYIKVIDPLDGQEKQFKYEKRDELPVKPRVIQQ